MPTSLVAAGDFGLRMLWGQWAFVVLLRAVVTVLLVTVRDGPWPGPGQLAVLGAWGAALALLTAGWRGVRRLL